MYWKRAQLGEFPKTKDEDKENDMKVELNQFTLSSLLTITC